MVPRVDMKVFTNLISVPLKHTFVRKLSVFNVFTFAGLLYRGCGESKPIRFFSIVNCFVGTSSTVLLPSFRV